MTPLTHPPSADYGLFFWVAVVMANGGPPVLDAIYCSAGWLLLDTRADRGFGA